MEPTTANQYAGLAEKEIAYIRGWSAAAFFMAPVWALCNRLYLHAVIGFVLSIAGGGLFVAIYMCIWGRRDAWKKRMPKDFPAFRSFQKRAAWISFIVFLILLVIVLFDQMATIAIHFRGQ